MTSRLFALLLAVLLAVPLAAAPAAAAPTREEIVAEVARATGLASDTVSLALEANPQWLDRLGTAVTAVTVIDKLLSAKDTELLVGLITDQAYEQALSLLPGPMAPFIKAVGAYKTVLEYIRDHAFVPAMEERVFAEYKRARGGLADYNEASPSQAFEQAIFNVFGQSGGIDFKGYWVQYGAQYDRLVKSLGYDPDLIGAPLAARLRRSLDDFWTNRLEAAYLQELAAKDQEALEDLVWDKVADITDQLYGPLGVDAGLFLDPVHDLPDGWWWITEGDDYTGHAVPAPTDTGMPNAFAAWQDFTISPTDTGANGYVYYEKSGTWCRTEGVRKVCDLPKMLVYLIIWQYPDVEMARASNDAMLALPGYQRLSDGAGWVAAPEHNQLIMDFVVGRYTGHLLFRSSDSLGQPTVDMAKYYGRIVAERMQDRAR